MKPTFFFFVLITSLSSTLPAAAESLANQREDAFEAFEEAIDDLDDALDDVIADKDWSSPLTPLNAAQQQWKWLLLAFDEDQKGTGRLKRAIWSDGSDFFERMNLVQQRLNDINESIAQQDQSSAASQAKDIRRSCKSCHRSYRSFW